MATPIVERRKVIIEYENRITNDLGSQDGNRPGQAVDAALVEAVRRELIKIGDRNGDIFGGRAQEANVADNVRRSTTERSPTSPRHQMM